MRKSYTLEEVISKHKGDMGIIVIRGAPKQIVRALEVFARELPDVLKPVRSKLTKVKVGSQSRESAGSREAESQRIWELTYWKSYAFTLAFTTDRPQSEK